MNLKQMSYLASPGTVSWRACEALGAGYGRKQQAMDAAAEVDPEVDTELKTQAKVAKAGLATAQRRQESGNDDETLSEGEIPSNPLTAGEIAADCISMIRAELRKRKAADAARKKQAKDAAFRAQLQAKIDRDNEQYKRSCDTAGAKMRGESVHVAPARKRTATQAASSLRLRATPAFSPRSFAEVGKRSFNFGMTQEEVNRATDEAIRREGARQRGEDVEAIGELTPPPDLNSKDPNVSFAAQCKAEGARQRAAAMAPPKATGLTYFDPYSDHSDYAAAGAKMRVGQDSAIDWTTKRFEIETSKMRAQLEVR